MKKIYLIYLIAIIPFILGICCGIAYGIIGSSVAPDGTLIEPFPLIAVGSSLTVLGLFLGIVIGIVNVIWFLFHKRIKINKKVIKHNSRN